MTTLSREGRLPRAARHVAWQSPAVAASGLARRNPRRSTALATIVALAVLAPMWLPRLLMIGEFSLAFTVPFLLALWALTQPAWPASVRRAVNATCGRGLWVEVCCVAALLILALMSMFVSAEPVRAFRVILPMAYAGCALILLSRLPPPAQRRWLVAILFAGALSLGLALLLSQTGVGRLLVMRDYRFFAFFENPNQLGVVILAVWPLAIALLLNARTARQRVIAALTVIVLIGAIVASGTKTALALGFVAGCVMWLYHGSRTGSLDKTLVKLVVILCLLVLAVPAILWIVTWASPAFMRRLDLILADGVWHFPSMVTRSVIWSKSIALGIDHPLLGVGAGAHVYNYAHSHNMLIDYFRGMGLFGLVAAVVLVLSAVARGAHFMVSTWHKGATARSSDAIIAGLYLGAISYLVGNQLSDSFSPTTSFLFWMMYFGAYLAEQPDLSVAPSARSARRSTRGWAPRAARAGIAGAAVGVS